MTLDNTQVQMRKGILEYCILHIISRGEVYASDVIEELTAAKQNILNGFPLRIDSNKKILEYLAVIGFYHLPLTYLDDFQTKISKVTVADVNAAFKRKINPDVLATVIVGSPEEKAQLAKTAGDSK